MKVSMTKFYNEITGSRTGNKTVIGPALERWGVPFDQPNGISGKGDAIDVKWLEVAREKYAAEVAARKERIAKVQTQKQAKRAVAAVADADGLALLVRLDDNMKDLNRKLDALMLHFMVRLS
jgi:hypothetical protein